jgi:hypothetical protein
MSRVFVGTSASPNETALTAPANAIYNNLTKFTVAMWTYQSSLGGSGGFGTYFAKDPVNSYAVFAQNGYGAGTGILFGVSVDHSGPPATDGDSTSAEGLVVLNQWQHWVFRFSLTGDRKCYIFLNGVEVAYQNVTLASAGSTLLNNSAGGWFLGNDTFNDSFDGRIGEVGIWNVALSDSNILALAAGASVSSISPSALVGGSRLCGTTLPEPDVSGNGNTWATYQAIPAAGPDTPAGSCTVPGSWLGVDMLKVHGKS